MPTTPANLLVVVPPTVVVTVGVFSTIGQTEDAAGLTGFRALPSSWSEGSGQLIRAIDGSIASTTSATGVAVIAIAVVCFVTTWFVATSSSCSEPPMMRLLLANQQTGRALILVLWISGGAVIVAGLQHLLVRPINDDALLGGNSMPSGHTYAFFAIAATIGAAAAMFGKLPSRSVACWFSTSMTAWSTLILVSTGHRPSDVLASVLIGQAVIALASNQVLMTQTVATVCGWLLLGAVTDSAGLGQRGLLGQGVVAGLSLGLVGLAVAGLTKTIERALVAAASTNEAVSATA